MKKTYITTLALAFVFAGVQTVSAQNATAGGDVRVGSSTMKMEVHASGTPTMMPLKMNVVNTAVKEIRMDMKNATGTASGTKMMELKGDIKEMRTDMRAEMKNGTSTGSTTKRAELKVEVKAKANTMIQERLAKIGDAFKNVVSNLSSYASRIEAEIAKVQAKGKDVTASTVALTQARVKINDVQVSINALTALTTASSTASSTDPRDTLETVKAAYQKVTAANQDARQALVNALHALRLDAGVRATGEASTTNER